MDTKDTETWAFSLISSFEGCKLAPYPCPAGCWSIGYGDRLLADGTPVTATTKPITQEQADTLLQKRISEILDQIRRLSSLKLTVNEAASLCSLAYNIGVTALASSTLLKKLNDFDMDGAANEFPRWDKMHKDGQLVEVPGLLARRLKERAVFLGKSAVQSNA